MCGCVCPIHSFHASPSGNTFLTHFYDRLNAVYDTVCICTDLQYIYGRRRVLHARSTWPAERIYSTILYRTVDSVSGSSTVSGYHRTPPRSFTRFSIGDFPRSANYTFPINIIGSLKLSIRFLADLKKEIFLY